jgi:serine/threonine-protein kinase
MGGTAAVAGPGGPLVEWLEREVRRLPVEVAVGEPFDGVASADSLVVQCTGSIAGGRPYEVADGSVVVDVREWRAGDADLPAEGVVVVFDPIGGPIGVAVDQSTHQVYTADGNGNTIDVINGNINTRIGPVLVGNAPRAVAIDESNQFVYTANLADDTVSAMPEATNAVLATVPVGAAPAAVGVDSARHLIYVANNSSNTVSVISGSAVTAVVPVGAAPTGIAVDSARGVVYVANDASNNVSVIDIKKNVVVATIPVGNNPFGVAVDVGSHYVYVTNRSDNTVSVFR